MTEPGALQLLRVPSGLSDRLNDDDNLEIYGQWMGGPGTQVHKAIGTESHYDKQRMAFTEPKPWHDLNDVLDACKNAGEKFAFNVADCTWGDVIGQMQKAEDIYKAKGDKNPIRRVFRHGDSAATNGIPLLNIIPDQWGLNILRAGLTLIFQAVQQREQNRETIFEAFKLIPEIIEKAQATREFHPKEEGLRTNVFELYKMLLEEMPQLIRILLRKHDAVFYKRWGRQIPGQEKNLIEASVLKVNKGYNDLKNCLDNIMHKKIAAIDQNGKENLRESKAVRETVSDTKVKVAEVSKDVSAVGQNVQAHREESQVQGEMIKDIEEKMSSVDKKMDSMDKKMDDMTLAFAKSQSSEVENVNTTHATTIQTGIYYISVENHYYYQGYPQIEQQQHSITPVYQTVSAFELLQIMNPPETSFDAANKDLGYVIKQSNTLKKDILGHGRWLMTTTNFKNWISGSNSGVLLVDGHVDRAKLGKTSPLSVFCATFIASIVKLRSTIVLHFFCGQHVDFNDPLRGAQGILRSLICQLLQYPNTAEPNLEMLNERRLLNDLKFGDLDAMCHVFRQLVQQIPRGTTIFCMIDNISEYETRINDSTEELRTVVKTFQAIASSQNQNSATFKILMTSANKSTEIVSQIPPYERVSLRAGNVYNGPISEEVFQAEVAKAKASIEASAPRPQALPWIEHNMQPAQNVWDMSRLSIQGPGAPQLMPWQQPPPQRVRTLVDADGYGNPVRQQRNAAGLSEGYSYR